jgi:hypothetical protein
MVGEDELLPVASAKVGVDLLHELLEHGLVGARVAPALTGDDRVVRGEFLRGVRPLPAPGAERLREEGLERRAMATDETVDLRGCMARGDPCAPARQQPLEDLGRLHVASP